MEIILSFFVIALMRAIQAVFNKKASGLVDSGEKFFRYGAFYQFMAAVFSMIALCVVGFYGFNVSTILCALISAVLFGVELFSSLQALKGCSIILLAMFSLGGMLVSSIIGVFWFKEPIGFLQAVGLFLFFVAAYLLSAPKEAEVKKGLSGKTFFMLLINLFANGFIMVTQKYFALKVSGGNVAMFSFLTFLFDSLIMGVCVMIVRFFKKNSPTERQNVKLSKTLFLCGTFLAFAIFMINLLVTNLGKTVSAVILFPVSSAISIFVTTLIGGVVFKEKFSAKNVCGLILGVLAIVAIGFFTP